MDSLGCTKASCLKPSNCLNLLLALLAQHVRPRTSPWIGGAHPKPEIPTAGRTCPSPSADSAFRPSPREHEKQTEQETGDAQRKTDKGRRLNLFLLREGVGGKTKGKPIILFGGEGVPPFWQTPATCMSYALVVFF